MGPQEIWSSWRCPDHYRGLLDDGQRSLSTQTILLFYNGQNQKDSSHIQPLKAWPSINQRQIAFMFQACKLLPPFKRPKVNFCVTTPQEFHLIKLNLSFKNTESQSHLGQKKTSKIIVSNVGPITSLSTRPWH